MANLAHSIRLEKFRLLGLFLSLLITADSRAQNASQKPEVKAPEPPADILGRTTPRTTVLNFLATAQKGDYETAARYLNTRKLGQDSALLAEQLYVILDRRLPAKLNKISDRPEGSLAYPAEPDRELVGTISVGKDNLEILLDRIDRARAGSIWLFSSRTLAEVPDVYTTISTVPPEAYLPEILIRARFAGIALYQWFAALVGLPLVYIAMGILNRVVSRLAGRVRRRLQSSRDLPNPECLPAPVRVLLLAGIIRWVLASITLPLLARQFWSEAAATITAAGIVWLIILLNGVLENYVRVRFDRKQLAGTVSILRFTRRLADILVVIIGVLVVLHRFGVNVAAAVAGLGVGGIAVALAAQKTLENVIGGVSLIFDQTVRMGDWLKLGDTLGVVEAIGLRSIRIRTLSRTVVSVPNGQVAGASLETLSSRDKYWFNHIVGLRYDTSAAQLRCIIEAIIDMLSRQERIDRESVRVSFLRFGESSLDVELYAYVLVDDMDRFFAFQQELLLRVMEIVQAAGVRLAIPSQTLFLMNRSPEETAGAITPPDRSRSFRPQQAGV